MLPHQYDALVAKVRRRYPNEIGGRNHNDILNLQTLAAKIDREDAEEKAKAPLIEAGTRLHHIKERAHVAKRKIDAAQESMAKNRRLHAINAAASEMLDPVELPVWSNSIKTVEDYEAATGAAEILAADLERRAAKIGSYVRIWDTASMAEQNRSLILALADRLDRLEAK